MPIHPPGKRVRNKYLSRKKKRNVVAVLSLTAMVDMFTVLAVFLLQNYNVTGQIIEIPQDVDLPTASEIRELKESNIVIVSNKEILIQEKKGVVTVISTKKVREQDSWMIKPLYDRLRVLIEKKKKELKANPIARVKDTLSDAKNAKVAPERGMYKKVTVSADKSIDFLTIKKVMFTVTEAGASEINFAVESTPEKLVK
ncbi:MAG: biopolymer transporter ExbD [Pseudomonadota bacterium]|nr:biopolymer transporter ExbD [Pseudomonadota bacterium]